MHYALLSAPATRYLPLAVSLVVSLFAVVEDFRYRRISNQLALILFLLGICSGSLRGGTAGFLDALFGSALAFLAFLLPYCLGGMGGGDVKLMAGFGALTGWGGILPALFLVALVGGLVSLVVLGVQRLRGKRPLASIPYAPAIVTGGLLMMVSQIGGN